MVYYHHHNHHHHYYCSYFGYYCYDIRLSLLLQQLFLFVIGMIMKVCSKLGALGGPRALWGGGLGFRVQGLSFSLGFRRLCGEFRA